MRSRRGDSERRADQRGARADAAERAAAGDRSSARGARCGARAPARRYRLDHRRGALRAPAVSHQAVYDVLRALTTAGLVRRIQPSGSVARYEARVGDNHHHVVCRSRDHRRRRLLRRCGTLPHRLGEPRLRHRRGRGHLLGPVPDCAAVPAATDPPLIPDITDITDHRTTTGEAATCPSTAARARTRSSPPEPAPGRPHTNQDWWPNQLNLQVLSQHSPRSNPMGESFDYAAEFAGLDVEALKRDVLRSRPRRRTGGRPTTTTTGRCSSG